jgi:hypothetical protein
VAGEHAEKHWENYETKLWKPRGNGGNDVERLWKKANDGD